jgi:hypothetical protein
MVILEASVRSLILTWPQKDNLFRGVEALDVNVLKDRGVVELQAV